MELHFRKITEDDLEMIMTWRTLPEVTVYMYTDFEPDIDKQRAWFRKISVDPARIDWIINVDGEDVGLVSIMEINSVHRRCVWGYYLASPSVRGKGIARSVELNILTYVFETLNLHKFCCEVFVSNEMVIMIHQKYGSKVEGTRPEHIYKNGQFHDIVEMGLLRSDWEKNVKGKIDYVVAKIDPVGKQLDCVDSEI